MTLVVKIKLKLAEHFRHVCCVSIAPVFRILNINKYWVPVRLNSEGFQVHHTHTCKVLSSCVMAGSSGSRFIVWSVGSKF